MKSTSTSFGDRVSGLAQSIRTRRATRVPTPPTQVADQAAQRILVALVFPSILMPLVSSMIRVALPVIRTDFGIQADMTAWVDTAFTLPFMILMPVYGRLSDGVGRRRLILAGIIIYTLGTAVTVVATSLTWIMMGRAIQGVGSAGMMPLGMALISSVFPAQERGKALGSWSQVGPTVGFFAPLAAGFLVQSWGWRAAFVPPLFFGVLAFFFVRQLVPSGLSNIRQRFWRSFDWVGVGLLAVTITSLLFFLSSRPITGVAPLQDWRLFISTGLFALIFLWWERRHHNAFIQLAIFRNRLFSLASLCAGVRMFTMSGASFLTPLYLVDIHGFTPVQLGPMLMVMPGAMAVMVRFGGQIADRWGSRWPVICGLLVQGIVMVLFTHVPETASIWIIISLLAGHGLGVGLMLAALHRAALGEISEKDMGAAAGLYSMIRFIGAACGTALAGVLLQQSLDLSLPPIVAYQNTFWFIAGSALVGLVMAMMLREKKI